MFDIILICLIWVVSILIQIKIHLKVVSKSQERFLPLDSAYLDIIKINYMAVYVEKNDNQMNGASPIRIFFFRTLTALIGLSTKSYENGWITKSTYKPIIWMVLDLAVFAIMHIGSNMVVAAF